MIVDAITAKTKQLRAEYEKHGWEVIEGPDPGLFPFRVGYYRHRRPALLAHRGTEHHVVEIGDTRRMSLDKLMERASAIRKQKGWSLLVASPDDVIPHDAPGIQGQPPSWPMLEQTVCETVRIASALPPWVQLLALWSALEGVLRRIAVDDGIPVDLLPASTLIPALYDQGLIPMKSYQPLKAAHEVHRRVRHGYSTPDEKVEVAVCAVSEWLPQLLPHAVERAA